jgi:hypothetical protein
MTIFDCLESMVRLTFVYVANDFDVSLIKFLIAINIIVLVLTPLCVYCFSLFNARKLSSRA